jgi:hypothetical protein
MDSNSAVLRASLSGFDGQHVALAHEGETLGELHPLGDAAELFAEDAVGAGLRQVTFLCRQPALVRSGCSCVSDDHALVPPWCPFCIFHTVERPCPIRQCVFYSDAISWGLLPWGMSSVGLPYSDKWGSTWRSESLARDRGVAEQIVCADRASPPRLSRAHCAAMDRAPVLQDQRDDARRGLAFIPLLLSGDAAVPASNGSRSA